MNHFIQYGSCGHVIAQCRCPAPEKSVEHVKELCAECHDLRYCDYCEEGGSSNPHECRKEDDPKKVRYSGAVSRAYAEQIIEQRDNLLAELEKTRGELAAARKDYNEMKSSRDSWIAPHGHTKAILGADAALQETLQDAARRVIAERNEATAALQSLHAEFNSLSDERDTMVKSRDRWIGRYCEITKILGAGGPIEGRDLPESTQEAAIRIVQERNDWKHAFDRTMKERDTLRTENERLQGVVGAVKAINWGSAMTYEGNLKAHVHMSVDTLNRIRAALNLL